MDAVSLLEAVICYSNDPNTFSTFCFPLNAMCIAIFQEIDYTKEATNAELFASNFKNMDYVKVPTILWDYTTPQV